MFHADLFLPVCFAGEGVDDDNDQRGEKDPKELVPIEEGDAEEDGVNPVIERYPQQSHERDQEQEQPPTGMRRRGRRALGRCRHEATSKCGSSALEPSVVACPLWFGAWMLLTGPQSGG